MNTGAVSGDTARVTERPDLSTSEANGRRCGDLGPRITSALVLAPVGIGAVFAGGPWLAAACAAASVATSWEWARMSEPNSQRGAFLWALAGAFGAVLLSSLNQLGWGLAFLAVCGAISALRRSTWLTRAETLVGAIYIAAPCALFIWLRMHEPHGLSLILLLFTAIWLADVFAYLGGTLIGGPKLHPALSPQKTWSGILAGIVAGAAGGAAFGLIVGGVFSVALVGIGAALAAIGLMGDLIESHLKRRFGVKDASGLIPGHGGVLDRIDGLMAATLVTAFALAVHPQLLSVLP